MIAETNQRIERREEAESDNLAAILKEDPGARIFVYCGYSHAAKTPQVLPTGPVRARSWMAAKLKQKTGLDPLTINQSDQISYPTAAGENPQVTAVLQRLAPRRPIVVRTSAVPLLSSGGSSFEPGAFDLAVYHARLQPVDGRPGWLAAATGRRCIVFDLREPVPAGSLLQARIDGPVNLAPADQYPAPETARQAVFFLRPGRYEVRLETPEGLRTLGSVMA